MMEQDECEARKTEQSLTVEALKQKKQKRSRHSDDQQDIEKRSLYIGNLSSAKPRQRRLLRQRRQASLSSGSNSDSTSHRDPTTRAHHVHWRVKTQRRRLWVCGCLEARH